MQKPGVLGRLQRRPGGTAIERAHKCGCEGSASKHDVGIRRLDTDNISIGAYRRAVIRCGRKVPPVSTAISGLEEAEQVTCVDVGNSGVKRHGAGRRHGQRDATRMGQIQHVYAGPICSRPSLAAVGGLEDAFSASTKRATQRRVGNISISGIEEYRVGRIAWQDACPGISPGGGAIDAVLRQQRYGCEQNLAICGMDSQSSDAGAAAVVTVFSHWAAKGPARLCPG